MIRHGLTAVGRLGPETTSRARLTQAGTREARPELIQPDLRPGPSRYGRSEKRPESTHWQARATDTRKDPGPGPRQGHASLAEFLPGENPPFEFWGGRNGTAIVNTHKDRHLINKLIINSLTEEVSIRPLSSRGKLAAGQGSSWNYRPDRSRGESTFKS